MLEKEIRGSPLKELKAARGDRSIAAGGNTIAFPLAGTIGSDGQGEMRHACSVTSSEDDWSNWRFHAVPAIANDCVFAILLELERKLLMFTAISSSWWRMVCESADNGKTWAEATGPLLHLLSESNAFFCVKWSFRPCHYNHWGEDCTTVHPSGIH
ncbi:trans-sialidase [Trypanosoma rangeli]|uniref:Trans-sialidase n=1 Tax=Trypanosoma rangeli TaxID=5698 RepID=A0A3R7LPB2_TRYRA|nr:trans-sialidase [Trypanosoma rangeli]RNF00815.1 trans-sialidase [Trypanosoma rangeli]|eukprot:RNF00815.1 trans-sialidase [Trypanosoma rangeli]